MSADADFFFELGLLIIAGSPIHGRRRPCKKTQLGRFHALYGASPLICSYLWALIVDLGDLDPYCGPKHLLWCLLFLKGYLTEAMMSVLLKADEKTIRKWVWYFIYALNDLEYDLVHGLNDDFL